jgi:septal ring factor EnvC (AmiA/AmiB activator)
MTSMWFVTVVLSVGIAALTVRAIQVTIQRDRWSQAWASTEQELVAAWDAQESLMYEVQQLTDDNQYLQETIAYWVEDRMSDSQWDNGRLPTNDTYANYDSPF